MSVGEGRIAVLSSFVTAVAGWQWHVCNCGQTGSCKVAVSGILVRSGTWQSRSSTYVD